MKAELRKPDLRVTEETDGRYTIDLINGMHSRAAWLVPPDLIGVCVAAEEVPSWILDAVALLRITPPPTPKAIPDVGFANRAGEYWLYAPPHPVTP